jgi:3-oxoacyl-[acyl-carrier protein] reductase
VNRDLLSLISLEGKTAVVTGGSRGIGRSICQILAKAGAFVAINYRTEEKAAEDVLRTIREQGGDGRIERFDVTDPVAVENSMAAIHADRGSVDILVNNAGIARDGLIGRMKDTDWNEVLTTNLAGAFHVCRAVSKSMIRRRSGRIINIASTAGEIGNAGQVNYSAAMAGLIGFTRALARELAPRNILVNAVSPGIITVGMGQQLNDGQLDAIRTHIPLRRSGEPADVAAAVLFLCSGMSDYITGQVIRVNGGLYM